ncbi:MAG: alginate export family protein [Candidatus Acidiferrales bacterium]
MSTPVPAQQQGSVPNEPGVNGPNGTASPPAQQLATPAGSAATTENGRLSSTTTDSRAADTSSKAARGSDPQYKVGPFTVFGNWRFRTEAWDWFQPSSGQNAYAFEHSLLRVGIGQKSDTFEWLVEGAQDAILDLPAHAVVAGAQGQLGLGGTYYSANGNGQNNANGFVRQAYVGFRLPANGKLRLGRFTFLDGAEVTPKDKTLATVVNTRISQRLIGDFGFSAVGRSYDGGQLSFDTGSGNFTVLGARPTRGVYQVDGMGELDVDLFYGVYTVSVTSHHGAGELRVFAVGYIDERGTVLKTDNRTLAARSADKDQIRIGTYGADYAHVLRTEKRGQFDFLAWGVFQSGSWGVQAQRSGAFVGEFGWQPPVHILNPWFSAGYSFGSGDSNPNDNTHGTFFQILPTPRPYARFPFYNMENNKDYYGTAVFRFPHSLSVRSEVHALSLADSQDLWYSGGGAFQPHSFGYAGRATGGSGSLANVWDVSLDCPLRYGFNITTYYGHAWGKSVIESIYPKGTSAQFGYVETNFRF